MKHKLLIVDDEINIIEPLTEFLSGEGFSVKTAHNLKEADQLLANEKFSLVILDWNLPDGHGVDWLKKWRSKQFLVPVIMLTARADTIDKVLGFEMGASDYVVKPYQPREILARIRARLRDERSLDELNQIIVDNIRIDKESRTVYKNNQEVHLKRFEFDLLLILAEKPNRVYSREEVLNQVWGYDSETTTRTIDNHIMKLRQKLETDKIETVRGIGYRFRHKI